MKVKYLKGLATATNRSNTRLHKCASVAYPHCPVIKALANEDTLLRTHCCWHKCFPVYPRAQQLLRFVAGTNFAQKHFVSATNVSQFAQLKKHHEQQCVRNNMPSFASTLKSIPSDNRPCKSHPLTTSQKYRVKELRSSLRKKSATANETINAFVFVWSRCFLQTMKMTNRQLPAIIDIKTERDQPKNLQPVIHFPVKPLALSQ